jgi:hypothetical protein
VAAAAAIALFLPRLRRAAISPDAEPAPELDLVH